MSITSEFDQFDQMVKTIQAVLWSTDFEKRSDQDKWNDLNEKYKETEKK